MTSHINRIQIPIQKLNHGAAQDDVKLAHLKNQIIDVLEGKRYQPMDHRTFAKKNMSDKVCLSPFVSVNIASSGEVRLCGCAAWMPVTVGNLYTHTLREILGGADATAVRASIADGSYIYCNEKTCGIINNNELNDRYDPHSVPARVTECLDNPKRFNMPNEIVLAGDLTCNLSCPSCRNSVIKIDDDSHELYQDLGDRIRRNLFSEPSADVMRLMLSTSGEIFASPMLLQMINTIPADDYPNLSLSLQSNGLLAPSRWHRLGAMQDRVTSIVITVDAGQANTYERLRRGGRWEDIMSALEWLANKKKQNGMNFVLRMIVQRDNYQEMQQLWQIGQTLGVDHVEYARILNWSTFIETSKGRRVDRFDQIDVFNPAHPRHQDAVAALAHMRTFPGCKFWGGL